MQEITRHPAVEWRGALQVVDKGTALAPSRIPPADGYQMGDNARLSASACSGVRMAFASDTSSIEVVGQPSGFEFEARPFSAAFDLVVDGELAARQRTDRGVVLLLKVSDYDAVLRGKEELSIEIEDRGRATLVFADLGSATKDIEIWLPSNSGFDLEVLAIDEGAEVLEPREPRGGAAKIWIHHGSSVSQCSEADGPTGIWPYVAASRAGGIELVNLGYGGECHTDQYVARYIRDAEADIISLKLGINSLTSLTERTFPSAVHGFLDTVRDGHPETPIVVCSPILCPAVENEVGPLFTDGTRAFTAPERAAYPVPGLLTVESTRSLISDIVATRRQRGDENLHYLDGLELFGHDDAGDLPDMLHPNNDGYRRMGERFADLVFSANGLIGSLAST